MGNVRRVKPWELARWSDQSYGKGGAGSVFSKIPIVPILIIAAVVLLFKPLSRILKAFGNGFEAGVKGIESWFSSFSQGIGFSVSPAGIAVQKITEDAVSPWYPNYWKKCPAGAQLLTVSNCAAYIADIKNSFGIFSDDYAKCFGVFKKLKAQSQLSFLSEQFSKLNDSKDLFTWLLGNKWLGGQDRLSEDELLAINSFIIQLPKY